eukprot:2565266-Alexandrium_andersonii.AAC.1
MCEVRFGKGLAAWQACALPRAWRARCKCVMLLSVAAKGRRRRTPESSRAWWWWRWLVAGRGGTVF